MNSNLITVYAQSPKEAEILEAIFKDNAAAKIERRAPLKFYGKFEGFEYIIRINEGGEQTAYELGFKFALMASGKQKFLQLHNYVSDNVKILDPNQIPDENDAEINDWLSETEKENLPF